jgi:hypothetical protein
MENSKIDSSPPSSASSLMHGILGKKIVQITRYSWWPSADVPAELGIEAERVFSLTYGPLGIKFDDGSVLGVAEQPSLNSVVVWQDRDNAGSMRHPPMDQDPDLFPIDCEDSNFSKSNYKNISGNRVIGLSVFRPSLMNALLSDLPSEVGLCLTLESGQKLVAGRGLHDEVGDFAVIGYEEIEESILSTMTEIALL